MSHRAMGPSLERSGEREKKGVQNVTVVTGTHFNLSEISITLQTRL